MREILFRGKRAYNGEWIYGDLFHIDGEVIICNHSKGFNIAVIPSTVGEFTGFTDMHGRKIFEGDILEFTNSDGEKTPYEIYWNGSKACWYIREYNWYEDDCSYWDPKHFEIIGNIYDNLELIKQED